MEQQTVMFELVTSWGKHVGYYSSVGALCKATGFTPDQVFDAIEEPVCGLYVMPTIAFIDWLEMLEEQIELNGNLGMSTVDIGIAMGISYQVVQQDLNKALKKMRHRAVYLSKLERARG